MALGILRSAFDTADMVAALRDFAASGQRASAWVIDTAGLATDARSPGIFIDRDRDPARLDTIEANSDRWTLATSAHAAALEYVIATMLYQKQERVGQRFAAYREAR